MVLELEETMEWFLIEMGSKTPGSFTGAERGHDTSSGEERLKPFHVLTG